MHHLLSKSWKNVCWYGMAILAFTVVGFAIYYPVLSGKFVIDDYGEIVLNKRVHTIKNIPTFFTGGTFFDGDPESPAGVYFRPIKMVWYAAIYTIFGPDPHYYHLFQIALHIGNTSLLFFVFLTALPYVVAFVMATIFLVHPLNVEAVAYIAAVQDPMFFGMGMSGLLYILTQNQVRLREIGILILIFIIGLLTKETMLVFGAIYLVVIYLKSRRYIVPAAVGMFASFIIYTSYRCGVIHLCKTGVDYSPLGHLPFLKYLAQMPLILFFYIKSFFYPSRLLISQHWYMESVTISSFYIPLLIDFIFFGILTIVLFMLYYRESTGRRAPTRMYTVYFWICVAGIFFHSHMLPLDFTVADQWFYVPMAGLLGMIGVILTEFISGSKRNVWLVIFSIVTVALAFRSMHRVYMWRDQRDLFMHDYRYNKDSYDLVNNVGYVLVQEDRNDEALKFFIRETKLAPDYPVGWVNAGVLYELKGDLDTAEKYYERATETGNHYSAYKRYLLLLMKRKKYREAKSLLENKILQYFPKDKQFRENYNIVQEALR